MNITDISAERHESKAPIRLAAYCRVSTDYEDQKQSFASQIRYYSEYTQKHTEYQLVDIYADEGLSGTDMKKRDEQNRLIRDCKKGKIDRVIVKSVSRFARNAEELLITLRLFKEIGVSVYFEEQDIDTDKLNMEMIVTFPGMAAQQESMSISGNLRWSYQKRMQSGDFNSTNSAYGFQNVNGQLIPKEDEMRVVRRIFDMYLSGMGTQSIASLLNSEHVPRRYNQKQWYSSTIKYILTNERYKGDALLQKSFTSDTLPFRKIRNIGQKPMYYVENSNPAIIDKNEYDAAQKLLSSRHRDKEIRKGKYILSGKIRCPDCGRAFKRQEVNGKAYWMCSGRSKGESDCLYRRVREDMIYECFVRIADTLSAHRDVLIGTLIRQIELMRSKTSDAYEMVRTIDKELADLNAQNLVITRLYTNGVLKSAEYAQQTSEISSKAAKLRKERQIKLAEDEDDVWLHQIKELDRLVREHICEGAFDEEMFEQVVERITVNSKSDIIFRLIGGIELHEAINDERTEDL